MHVKVWEAIIHRILKKLVSSQGREGCIGTSGATNPLTEENSCWMPLNIVCSIWEPYGKVWFVISITYIASVKKEKEKDIRTLRSITGSHSAWWGMMKNPWPSLQSHTGDLATQTIRCPPECRWTYRPQRLVSENPWVFGPGLTDYTAYCLCL